MNAEELAELFHTFYERLAPTYGYQTQSGTAVPWSELAEDHPNKRLTIATAREVLHVLSTRGLLSSNAQRDR